MVTGDETTQSAEQLLDLAAIHGQPILSIHAPVLLLTHFVWGRDPQLKLRKSAELAREVGATAVVVHPPFRWQTEYADTFLASVRTLTDEFGVEIAIENMFPWKVRGRGVRAYSPSWDPSTMDCDASTLDFSHAALSGKDAMRQAIDLGPKLRHIHLCDGSRSSDEGRVFDEHLLPGHGNQPVAEVLQLIAGRNWSGNVIAEVNTRKARTESERDAMLRETLEFARLNTTVRVSGAVDAAPARSEREASVAEAQ